MDATCHWRGGLGFEAFNRQHSTKMDAKPPFGKDQAPTPKELLLNAICGCTAMDVVSYLRKTREEPTEFTITAQTGVTSGHPSIFDHVQLIYKLSGQLNPTHVVEAVVKSMSLYCGVSAMVTKACPISYSIELNGNLIGSGEALFP